MPTARDRVLSALHHQPVDRPPRDLWPAPAVESFRPDELAEIRLRYPPDIVFPDFQYSRGHRSKGNPLEPGQWTDAWGCVWNTPQRGADPEPLEAPLADAAQLAAFRPPREVIERMNLSAIQRSCTATSRFVLAATDVAPFQRLLLLRGPATLEELQRGTADIRRLLNIIHDYYAREIEVWASTEVDAVAFGDSWAGPERLGISLDVWRDLFKPLYRQYCDLLRRGDKFAFFRAGGDVTPVLDELIEIGVDAVHCPLHLLPLETVVQRWRDRVTFWIGLDNPRKVVDGPREAIRQAVQRVQAAFEPHRGGLVVHCPWPPQAPFDHVAAMLEQWLAPPHPHPCHARRIR